MPLHVLQLGPYPPPEGGISRNMLAIRDDLIAKGHKCSVIATSRSSEITDEPDVYHPRTPLGFIGVLRRLKFDVLHLHIGGDVTTRVLVLALVCSIFGRGRSVLTMHSGGFATSETANAARPGSLAGRIFRSFSRVIAVNEKLAEVFRRFGVEQVEVIPPYALKLPDPSVTIPGAIAGFCSSHSPLIVTVGGLEPDYDPLMQISAMNDILADLPNAGLMIVGSGSMRSVVEEAIAASGYADAIMLTGNVEHAVTLHLMKEADVVLRTTLFDGDAISVREALFFGTPVIATDTGERPDGVHLIAISDREGLAKTVREIAGTAKAKPIDKVIDNSNIDAVVSLYAELAI